MINTFQSFVFYVVQYLTFNINYSLQRDVIPGVLKIAKLLYKK